MNESRKFIRVGVVGRAHGIKGAVRVFLDDPESDALLRINDVYLGEELRRYKVVHGTRCNRFIALELEGVADRDAAFELTGEQVSILRSSLRPLRRGYYACDLVGLTIVDSTGKVWGVVVDVVPSGAHDMLRYRNDEGVEGFVPFVSAHVGTVDLDAGTVLVDADWMTELNAIYKG